MGKPAQPQQAQIIQSFKQIDDVFHIYATERKLSDTAFWILYTLCESEKSYTQNELCEQWYYSKQTIHSAVAGLVKDGLLILEHISGSRNSKSIALTAQGHIYVDAHIQPLLEAERKAFAALTSEERNTYSLLIKKHLDLFRREVDALKEERTI